MYINSILVLKKGSFYQHIDQLRVMFSRLRAARLKANATKCIFGLGDITFL